MSLLPDEVTVIEVIEYPNAFRVFYRGRGVRGDEFAKVNKAMRAAYGKEVVLGKLEDATES